KRMIGELKDFSEVEYAATADTSPYSFGTNMSGYDYNGRTIQYHVNNVTDDFDKVMGLTFTRGRWFGKDDQDTNWNSVVINEKFAHELFGDEDPIGKEVPAYKDSPKMRIIGLITAFRKDGEFAEPVDYVF